MSSVGIDVSAKSQQCVPGMSIEDKRDDSKLCYTGANFNEISI